MTSTRVFVPLDIRITLNFAHICEKAKFQAILLTDFSNFWNLGSKFLVFFAIFSNFLALPVSKFPAFFEHNGDRSTDPTPLQDIISPGWYYISPRWYIINGSLQERTITKTYISLFSRKWRQIISRDLLLLIAGG